MESTELAARVVLIGIGATVVMDLWGMVQKALGMPTLGYALVGRWAGHLCRGKVSHTNIGRAEPIPGESPLGWTIHYAVGLAFAALLVGIQGPAWLRDPTWLPALAVGLATVVMPFFVMQPAMGAGIAASRTPTPWRNRLRSLATHAVFGCGLYLSAAALRLVWA
ncbi:DUF2938 domain-containing protein [Achromobacter anxifer]